MVDSYPRSPIETESGVLPNVSGGASPDDPCPCGSGLRYRKCCRVRVEEERFRRQTAASALSKAFSWLRSRHRRELEDAIEEGFFGGLTAYERSLVDELPERELEQVEINAIEWVIAEGWLEQEDRTERLLDRVLEAQTHELEPAERSWLRVLGGSGLRLYCIADSPSDEGVWASDQGDDDAEPIWIEDASLATRLGAKRHFAGRLLQTVPGRLSGALYPMSSRAVTRVERDVLETANLIETDEWEPEAIEASDSLAHSAILITAWLRERIDQLVGLDEDHRR